MQSDYPSITVTKEEALPPRVQGCIELSLPDRTPSDIEEN